MANNIKYLDQKGLKTFHDATGWVTIEIPVNGKFVVYDESPIKFINGGLMDIGNMPNQGISAGDVKRFAKGTLIVNKANSEIKLEIFTRHYNQLIQHEFKTDKLTLPGTTSQVVLGDGSLKELDNLVVGNAKNAEKVKTRIQSGPIYLLGTSDSLYEDYNTILKNSNCYIEADGLTLKVPTLSITKGGLSITEGSLSITEGVTTDVLQGNGKPISKMSLEVGRAQEVKISNINIPSDLATFELTYPLLGSLGGDYNSPIDLNGCVFYSIVKDPISNTISKTLIVADGEDENHIPLRGSIYGNLDGVATNADIIKTQVYTKNSTPPDITYPILVKGGDNNLNQDEYITPVSSRDVYLKRVGDEYATLYAQRIKISKDPSSGSNDYVDVASQEWVNIKINNLTASEEDIIKIFTNTTNNNTNTTT